MPSPVGHTLAGLCGFLLGRERIPPQQRRWWLASCVAIANLPDLDILPGLMLYGDPSEFHRDATHSIFVGMAIAGSVWAIAKSRGLKPHRLWGVYTGGLYLSHILLDMLVADPFPPTGVQAFWPFSFDYFAFPIAIFARFDYFDPALGMLDAILSWHNFFGVLREILILTPALVGSYYLGQKIGYHLRKSR
ncbi:metal-dependent hydrolase [Oxynema aestuarii]|jgi:inner membrane protein|uniref:Metal-dependent hydrolase n=1 Tax=Oxynema aestuarii AP17 TaxID=2064643 RepID=A0A6H1U002_9CYAN|nr:metal-dependent hydrolase [Oxynema aestuarii]QIZ71985.1 metal-dependent hydrolase [Oxynema aestuarii AP17]RMH72404.1 MAG: metal-dependent hydrolase [Cyanobacteria bacterium J007]